MAIGNRTECGVPGCGGSIVEPNNLCEKHRLPGEAIRVDDSTMVITCWYAEHGKEVGVILLNDLALGKHFGGGEGFAARLQEQGFANVRNLPTPGEVMACRNKAADWSGPWKARYPWEKQKDEQYDDDVSRRLYTRRGE